MSLGKLVLARDLIRIKKCFLVQAELNKIMTGTGRPSSLHVIAVSLSIHPTFSTVGYYYDMLTYFMSFYIGAILII
jgi:hypothetical protein